MGSVEAGLAFLANAATLGLALATVVATGLRRSDRFRRWCLRLPLRRGVPRDAVAPLANLLGTAPRRRDVLRALQAPSLRILDGEAMTAGDAVSDLLRAGRHTLRDAPHASRLLSRAYAVSTRGSSASLLSRLLYADEVAQVRHVHRDLVKALTPFATASVVERGRADSDPASALTFAGFVTALSGAPVLVDAAAIRSRHADGVVIWHQRRYRDSRGEVDERGFAQLHESGACTAWAADRQLPGDFDRRMLDIRSAAVMESSATSSVTFALGTWETCYAATELGSAMGCKKVRARLDGHDPQVDPVFTAHDGELAQRDAGRLTLLTSYVSVLTADGVLALVRRSGSVRNGAGVISASAGGIVEPDEPGPTGDISESGLPDPLVTATRESLEEIGLDLPHSAVKPVAVFLANVRERSSNRSGTGQLVGVVLSLARTDRTLDQLRVGGHSRSDMSKGRFEWDDFVSCPTSSAVEMAAWARGMSADLDQHGLLSIVYASMTLHGPRSTRDAFSLTFDDGPWWCGPAAGANGYRVCRDPGPLVGVETDVLLDSVLPSWGQARRAAVAATASAELDRA